MGYSRRWQRQLRYSIEFLMTHRLRTALCLSGLVVGGAAATIMGAVSAGAERRVLDRVRALGTNLIIVQAPPAARVAGRVRQAELETRLRPADAEAVLESRLARRAAPAVSRPIVAHANGLRGNTILFGTTGEGLAIRNLRTASGRLFDQREEQEQRRVALLGRGVAGNLFGGADPIGQRVMLGPVPFEVIGVLAPRGTDPGGTDLDNVVVVPLGTAMRRVLNIPYVHALYVQGRSSNGLDALAAEIQTVLEERHPTARGRAPAFQLQNQAVLLRTERGSVRALRTQSLVIGALALGLGAVGVLTMMLMAARDRVGEVGLRRAVGASGRDIGRQFLTESALLAAVGGGAGVTIGMVTAGIVSLIGSWDLVLPWGTAGLAVSLSLGLGLASGVLPALRAARIEPVVALRTG